MKNVFLQFARPRSGSFPREQGFVQGVLLFALAVLVAIIAAFAFANNSNNSSSERESAKVTATVLMKQAADVQDAVSRYVSDGMSLKYLCVTSGVSAVAANTTEGNNCNNDTTSLAVDLFTSANGYITPPVPPDAAFEAGTDAGLRNFRYKDLSLAGRALSVTGVPPGNYAYMEATNIDKKVCQAINRVLGLAFPYDETSATKEQCYGATAPYTYRKVIASREEVGL